MPRLAFELESDLQRLHLASAHDARAALALSAATLDRLARALMGSDEGDEPEHFARGQFRAMTDAEKLSKPAYEAMRAGCVLSSAS